MLTEKIIKRGKYPPIIKREISTINLINYEDIDIELVAKLLNETVCETIYNTMDLLKLLMFNYKGNMKEAINNINDYSTVRFNCYHASKLLKSKLSSIGLESKYLSYKSIGFSTPDGDSLIKEAHLSILLPTVREEKIYYVILDPGYRIPSLIGFYKDMNSSLLRIDNDET